MSNNRELGYVVGAVAAYFTGGASYIALGATIGGVVGGLLDPKTQTTGPRLDDLKVQMSTYGIGIPRLYGTERISPNVVWSTNKIETSTTTTSGKGGGGTENTSFRYYVHMRLLLCETPRETSSDGSDVQIVQIFADGKLQWDARSGIPVEAALASAENPFAFFTLYQGHADQLPDAVEEINEAGPGSVPAYRGVVSIAMRGIECPGGRVPQFSFVLSVGAEAGQEKLQLVSAISDGGTYRHLGGLINGPDFVHYRADLTSQPDPKVVKGDAGGLGYLTPMGQGQYPEVDQGPSNVIAAAGSESLFQLYHETPTDTAENIISVDQINPREGGARITVFEFETALETIYGFRWAAVDPVSGAIVLVPIVDSPEPGFYIGGGLFTKPPAGFGPVAMYDGLIYMVSADGTTLTRMDSGGGVIDEIAIPLAPLDASGVVMVNANASGVYIMGLHPLGDGGIFKVALSGSSAVTLLSDDVEIPDGDASRYVTFYANDNYAVIGPTQFGDGTFSYDMIRFHAVNVEPVKVSVIIAAECEIAGETRYDVSGIPDTDTVIGYKIGSPASARANIDPLLTAFQIFIVDEDGAIKFRKYADITSVATITFDELGQAEDGSEPSDPMPLNRSQEIDMPKSVSVSYIEPLNDYQVATEREIRQITEATEDMLVQLPMAITSDQAKRAATSILFSRWRSQNTRSLKVSRKYAFLSPGDGTTVEYPLGTFRLWRWTQVNDTGALIEGSVEPGDAALWTQEATGATGYVGQQVAALPPPTQEQIIDGPILRDADNNAGLYVALAGYGPGWPGASLFVGPDEASMQSEGTVSNSATQGFAETALGDWDLNVVDESSLLTVNVGQGELESITRDALLTGTVNVAAVGVNGRWEYIKFQRADSLGSGRFILSGLMRGMRGTEHNRGNHESGDVFVLLSIAGMLRPNLPAAEIGQTQFYMPVTTGRASGTSKSYTNTAEGLEPFSPTNLVKDFDGDDITLEWVRRTRLSENWLMGIVPLGEASERWQVVIYADDTFATVVRTINTTTAAAVYTSAQQVADFASNQTEISVRIAQLSDVVGAGHELESTL